MIPRIRKYKVNMTRKFQSIPVSAFKRVIGSMRWSVVCKLVWIWFVCQVGYKYTQRVTRHGSDRLEECQGLHPRNKSRGRVWRISQRIHSEDSLISPTCIYLIICVCTHLYIRTLSGNQLSSVPATLFQGLVNLQEMWVVLADLCVYSPVY
jgi:hypothetical protein